MARPKVNPGALPTELRILRAAEAEFATHGFTRAKLGDIAAAVGIRRPSLLYHYKTKHDLYGAVLTDTFNRLGAALRMPMEDDGPFVTRLQALVEGFVGFMDDHPACASMLVWELVGPASPGQAVLVGYGAPLLDEVERWIRETGGDQIREGINLRRATMQVVSAALLRNASGPAVGVLWGRGSVRDSWMITKITLLNLNEETQL